LNNSDQMAFDKR